MVLLLDTHLLLWLGEDSPRLSREVRELVEDPENQLFFSVVSVWEMAIKFGQRRTDFLIDPRVFRMDALRNGYQELEIRGEHAIAVASLPPLHKDPFDRILVAQAMVEGILLLTVDATLLGYPAPVRLV